jgi:hypothetical protein
MLSYAPFGYNLTKLCLSADRRKHLHVLGHETRSREKLDQRSMCQIVALNLPFANGLLWPPRSLGGTLHAISFKNNFNTLANRSHLQKVGHFEDHNDYLILPLIMTELLQMTSDGSHIVLGGNINIVPFNKNVKLFLKAIFQVVNFGGSYLKILKKCRVFFSLSYFFSNV